MQNALSMSALSTEYKIPEILKTYVLKPSERSQKAFQDAISELASLLKNRVEKNPHATEEYILLGKLFRLLGDTRRAYRLHRNILAKPLLTREQEISIFTELGYDLLDLKIPHLGEKNFHRALALRKNHIPALQGLVKAFEQQNHLEKTSDTLKVLIKLGLDLKKQRALVLAAIAHQYFDRKLFSKARRFAEDALDQDSTCPYAKLMLADAYLETQRYEKAKKTLQSFLVDWPALSFLALRRLEDVHYRMNAFSTYEDTLRECIRANSENFYLHYSLARHLQKKHRQDGAIQYLDEALNLNPLYVNAIRDKTEIRLKSSDSTLASQVKQFFSLLKSSRRFVCPECGEHYKDLTWNCARCGLWTVFDIRYELSAP